MTTTPLIWDVHHHWVNESGYIDRLLHKMDQLGIERVGLIAMGSLVPDLFLLHGPRVGSVDNEDLAVLVKKHPDRFWGWGFVQLGSHERTDVDRLVDLGLTGLKFHIPLKPYDDPQFFLVYERAQQLNLPCLFHTGIFTPPSPMPGQGVRSSHCRPIFLESIAQEFPQLRMVCAHFGSCWNEEAAAICRICPNIYADLSGRVNGWRSSKSLEWFKQTLYWEGSHRKILFGSDVHSDEIEQTVEDHRRIFQGIGWNEHQIEDVFMNNAKCLMDSGA